MKHFISILLFLRIFYVKILMTITEMHRKNVFPVHLDILSLNMHIFRPYLRDSDLVNLC